MTGQELREQVVGNIGKVIVGKEEVVTQLLTALLAEGHVLLEDVPGTGKTKVAKSLAKSLNAVFSRIQFTPDLLPGDITGLTIYDQKQGEFVLRKGPAFTNILLADEINRATPRTQSALLECMEEKQITEGGVTYDLHAPFLVIATQNPVETQGTFKLPEAQLDRFLIQITLGYPDARESLVLMQRFINSQPLAALEPVAEADQITEAAQLICRCAVSEDVMCYMAAVCEAARNSERVRLGPSPRALLALMRCCQALAAIRGRDYVIPDDVKELAVPVLAHRMVMRGVSSYAGAESFLQEVLKAVSVPTEQKA